LAKVLQDPDKEPHPRPWELVGLSEGVWSRSEGRAQIAPGGRNVYKPGTRQWMLSRIKELGLKQTFGMKNEELRAILEEAGEKIDG
jgi:hypothetical protein